ncbi:nuclear transport factor 2 family protein [Yoonia sp. R2331]|uniref:nuclear transport factor 2 family protein n=1 Tax=Yoonia sp. R2331 TaxID=3237238 RepID=UPI0034E5779D
MTTHTPDPLKDAILAAEMQVWQALVAGDAGADAALLCDSFLGVYADGFADKAAHTGQLADGPSIKTFALHDVQVRALGVNHALIAYQADFTRINSKSAERMYVSSVWERRGETWINLFSQDTSYVAA